MVIDSFCSYNFAPYKNCYHCYRILSPIEIKNKNTFFSENLFSANFFHKEVAIESYSLGNNYYKMLSLFNKIPFWKSCYRHL